MTAAKRGRPRDNSPEFYLSFAEEYDKVEWRRRRRESTRAILAAKYHVTDAVIGKWIRHARRLGFLTDDVEEGSRGSYLTRSAEQLLNARAKTTAGEWLALWRAVYKGPRW